jgi:hypothetical protein
MSPEFQRVVALVDNYLAKDDYMALWNSIDGPGAMDREPGPFAPTEEQLFDELHEIVHMGQQTSATPEEHRVGLRGGPELHARLRQWRTSAEALLSA